MSEENADTIEYLLEEYALDRLHGDGLARVEEVLRAQSALRARVAELRRESALIADALSHGAAESPPGVDETTLALLMDGALDELECASLEASLAGDLQSQARLSALYREVNAVLNDEPVDIHPAKQDSSAAVIPFKSSAATSSRRSNDVTPLIVCATLGILSLLAPPAIGVPILFAGLAVFGWWAVRHATDGGMSQSTRRRSYLGLAPSVITFAAGLFAGPLAIWCYVCGAAWYWYWLVQRWSPVQATTEAVETSREEARADGKRG